MLTRGAACAEDEGDRRGIGRRIWGPVLPGILTTKVKEGETLAEGNGVPDP